MTNKDVALALHEIWSGGDLGRIAEIYAHDFVAHWPQGSEIPKRRGREGVRAGILRIRTAFPDWKERVLDLFGEGDRVASRYVSTGTHRGLFWGIEPTGRRVEIQEMSIYRFAGGQVVEQWCLFDELGRLRQLGAVEAWLAQQVPGESPPDGLAVPEGGWTP